MSKIKHKIAAIVTAQIILIIASFLTIVYFESQAYHAGNIVNVAGKNRALATTVHAELVYEILHYGQLQDGGGAMSALGDLEDNILFLKEGGTMHGIEISPLSQQFHVEWDAVWGKFGQYEGMVTGVVSDGSVRDGSGPAAPLEIDVDGIKRTGDELVALSDVLTDRLGRDVDAHSTNLILLQAILGIVNVIVHIFMIILIWRILNKHAEQRIRMEKFATMGKFAAMMAHNMKNPLGTILNSATLIRRRSDDADTVGLASDKIERAVRHMSHQIDGVMNYVRDVPFVTTTESVQKMLRRSLDLVSVPEHISASLPENDTLVTCDSGKMEIVFANLLLNAIQAIGNDRGHITIRLTEDAEDGAPVILEFENSGPAIPEKDIHSIFEPLFTTKMSGAGLGLASCRSVMGQHGGSITAGNDPVRFTLRIPRGTEESKTAERSDRDA